MAKLDAFIEVMFREKSERLFLQTGMPASLSKDGVVRSAMQRPLTTVQISGACAELLPADRRRELEVPDQELEFDYASPYGHVTVRFRGSDQGVRVVIEPYVPPPQAEVKAEPTGFVRRAVKGPTAVAPEPLAAMQQLLEVMVRQKASDLHLTSEYVPCARVDGDILEISGYQPLPAARLKAMLLSIAPERNRAEFEKLHDTDFAYETKDARFRVNLFADRYGPGAVLRRIPTKIVPASEMGLPKQVMDLCFLHKGLVLVTGPTGSGKSTTLAGLIDHINRNRDDHILTIEDPIEFVHPHQRCLVRQREVGVHTAGFKSALRAALREDPDVVLVGELRDLETISIALETAETGHLVFGTLHTNTAPSTVDRIIDQFPADRQAQVRTMLSESLKGVIAQTLCKRNGGGRVAAHEILLVTPAVSNLIREGKTFQIPSVMQTAKSQGMQQLNDALLELVKKGLVTAEEAVAKAVAKNELKAQLEKLKPA